ncbi:MAG: ABC transporter ATP-binding protein [Archaeoglobaceae archaeon]
MIEIRALRKSFGNKEVLKGISLEIKNEIFGLLGPNGSGKTTLMKTIAGILKPSSGDVVVDGMSVVKDPLKVKSIVGFVAENPVLYESLTVSELFNLVGKVRRLGRSEIEEKVANYARAFEIQEFMDSLIADLSFGTKQKVAIISALLHDPKALILDEAMNGLDVRSAKIFRNLLFKFREEGKSIVFSTHVMPFVEVLCDRVAIIYDGRIVAEGSLKDLKEMTELRDLEDVFLKLTGGVDALEVASALL